MTTAEEIREAVLAHYLALGRYASVREIAERLGWSETKVRAVLAENHGSVAGTVTFRASVPKYSKAYPGMEAGYTQAWVYSPAPSLLAERLQAAQDALRAIVEASRDRDEHCRPLAWDGPELTAARAVLGDAK